MNEVKLSKTFFIGQSLPEHLPFAKYNNKRTQLCKGRPTVFLQDLNEQQEYKEYLQLYAQTGPCLWVLVIYRNVLTVHRHWEKEAT